MNPYNQIIHTNFLTWKLIMLGHRLSQIMQEWTTIGSTCDILQL
jgi:hypothetical protein